MSKKWFAVAAMVAGLAFAAETESSGVTPNLDKGTKVLEGAGSINLMADEVQLQLAYGQFVADGIEVALVAGLHDNDLYMSTELGVRAEYNLVLDSALVPFMGAGVVWANAEADDSDIDTDAAVFSVGGGVKYFFGLTRHVQRFGTRGDALPEDIHGGHDPPGIEFFDDTDAVVQ